MILSVFPFRPHALRLRAARGSTLAATMMVVAAIASFLSIAALVTSQSGRFSSSQQGKSDQVAACDAALEYAYAQWKTAVTTAIKGGGAMPKASACAPLPSSSNPMWSRFNNVYGASGGFAASTGVIVPTPTPGSTQYSLFLKAVDQNGNNPIDDVYTGVTTSNVPGYPGWSGQTFFYKATATVANTGRYGATGSVSASRYFQITRVPLFQAAIFYENKLEIHPGAAMVVTGLVHTNGDLWAQGFNNLTFKSNVSYVGAFHQDADSTVTKGWDGYGLKSFPGDGQKVTWSNGSQYDTPVGSTNQLNVVTPIDPFGGAKTSDNGLHDIIEIPPSGNTSNQYAYNNASLIITVNTGLANNAAGRYTITDGDGVVLTDSGSDKNYSNVLAAIGGSTSNSATTTSSITDMREAATVTITNLDMTKLAAATVPAKGKTANTWQAQFAAQPTVYIRDVGGTSSSTRRAVRLVNGRSLGQNVSVASDGGMYIQGDYNTGGSSASDVPSNGADNTDGTKSPVASNYTRYSSSVMADAVTILSNSWNDNNSANKLAGVMGGSNTTGRVATATTVNTAILAGDVPSNLNGNGQASGGAHNFPRFLENWSDKNFTYYGSLVEAFRSEKFTGLWQTNNVYTWPNRMWNFDTNFVNNPPPGAPAGMQFSRGRYERLLNQPQG